MASTKITKISGKRVGDKSHTLLEMTRSEESMDGREWPAGTLYTPGSLGYSAADDGRVQTVTIGSESVRFRVD